jgi:pimeloyl-ACP methyl ester carboxylesterase
VIAAALASVALARSPLHYECSGSGAPTVVLDAGLLDSTAVWSAVQPAIARHARVCAYDRAGNGQSSPVHGARTARDQVDDLRRLLASARIRTPIVLVGHSWGGLLARLFTHDYPSLVAGVVLVDATTFPYAGGPARANKEGVRPAEAKAESDAVTSFGPKPLVVLGSTGAAKDAKFMQAQEAEAALSTDSVDAIAAKSTHYIQSAPPKGQPGVVIAAVDAVVQAVRTHGRLPACRRLFAKLAVVCR